PLLYSPLLFFLLVRPPPRPTLFPYTTLFRSALIDFDRRGRHRRRGKRALELHEHVTEGVVVADRVDFVDDLLAARGGRAHGNVRSEEHTSELQSLRHLVCRLLLEKKKKLNRQ